MRFTRRDEPKDTRSADDTGRRTSTDVAEREHDGARSVERDEPRGAERAERAPDPVSRERAEFGGLSWGSAFFGWLVAVGIAALLTAIVSAAGAAVGITEQQATGNAETVGLVGAILLVIILLVAYYAGGYVAGRMARFNGPRQGLGVWIIGLAITVLLAVAGVVLDAEYNVLQQLNLPRIPVEEGTLTTGGLITLAVILVGTLVAAMGGGKAGTRFHRRVDRAGLG
jgi:MFS family permease